MFAVLLDADDRLRVAKSAANVGDKIADAADDELEATDVDKRLLAFGADDAVMSGPGVGSLTVHREKSNVFFSIIFRMV